MRIPHLRRLRSRLYLVLAGALLLTCALLLWHGRGLTLVNFPGLVLVLGGTLMASVIGHSTGPVLALLRRIPQLFREAPEVGFVDHKPFLQVANMYRRGAVRSAEQAATGLRDPFLRDGARLALDPHNGDELGRVLQWRIRRQKEQDTAEVRILRTMATFAPAFGMLGTLFGLVSLLDQLGTSGLDHIGMSMGFALMSTLYGLMVANLLFRPLALKLEDRSRQRLSRMGFLSEALVMLYRRDHPLAIGEYFDSALESPAREALPPTAARLVLGRT